MDGIFDLKRIDSALRLDTRLTKEEIDKYVEVLALTEQRFMKEFPSIQRKIKGLYDETLDALNSNDREALLQLAQELTSHDRGLGEHLAPRFAISDSDRKAIDLLTKANSLITDDKDVRIGLPWDNSIVRTLLVRALKDKAKALLNVGIQSTLNRDRFVNIHVDDAQIYREGYAWQILKMIEGGFFHRRPDNEDLRVVFHASSPGILDWDYEMKTRGKKTPESHDPAGAIDDVWEYIRSGKVRLSYYWDRNGLCDYVEKLKAEYSSETGHLDESILKRAITKSMAPYLGLENIQIMLVSPDETIYSNRRGGLSNVFGNYAFQYVFRTPEQTKYVITVSRLKQPRELLASLYKFIRQMPVVNKRLGRWSPLEFAFDHLVGRTEEVLYPSSEKTIPLKGFHSRKNPEEFYDRLMAHVG